MIPKKIHQTAPTKQLSSEERRVLAKNRSLMKGWEFFLHDDLENQEIMNAAFPEYAEPFRAIRRGVVKADIARCVYLFHFGGWYFDTDYKLIRSLESASVLKPEGSSQSPQECAAILPVSGEADKDQHLVCNSIMASEKGHPFWRAFIDHIFADDGLEQLSEGNVESTTGPLGLSRFYLNNQNHFPDIVLPPKRLFHPRVTHFGFWRDAHADCYGVHWCWGSWRSKGLGRKIKNFTTRKLTSFF